MMKKRLAMMVVLVVTLVMGILLPLNVVTAEAASMKLSSKNLTLTEGKKKKLTVKNLPSTSTVKWSTSNKKIATVTSKGKVTAKKTGKAVITATITAKSGKKSKLTCKVTVKAAPTVADSKYRYVGVVYEGEYDLTISKVDKNGIPTEIIIFGEKIALEHQQGSPEQWSASTGQGGYMEAYFSDNYEILALKGSYGSEYKRTNRTDNEPINTDKTIMEVDDNVMIIQGDTAYTIRIVHNKSNSYYLTKSTGNGESRKETTGTYSVTEVCKGDGWSFDCTTCTLTLDNAKLKFVRISASCDMTVKLIGENEICNDMPDGDLYSYQIGYFDKRNNAAGNVNVIFTGDGSVNFCRPDWYKDDYDVRDHVGLRLSNSPLILQGSCTVTANGRYGAFESGKDIDITIGEKCTLHLISETYGTIQGSDTYSRKLTVNGTFIAEVSSNSDYASVFQGTWYNNEVKALTPELVIGSGNSLYAGENAETAVITDKDQFVAARYVRIGRE